MIVRVEMIEMLGTNPDQVNLNPRDQLWLNSSLQSPLREGISQQNDLETDPQEKNDWGFAKSL